MNDDLKINEQDLKLLYEEGEKSYFSARRFYNPAIWVWLQAGRTALPLSSYYKLHNDYFSGLSHYAQGVITKDLKEILKGLELLCNALNPHLLFKDFILFKGVFQSTAFLVNPDGRIQASVKDPKEKKLILRFPDETAFDFNAFNQCPLFDNASISLQIKPAQGENIFGAVILPIDRFEQLKDSSIKILYKGGDRRPKDELIELFDGRETVKTEEIGSLGFTNPFSQILCCNFEPEFNAFENALECLKNDNFDSQSQKHSLQGPIQKNCVYCGKPFSSNIKKKVYCNSTCRNKAFRDRESELASKNARKQLLRSNDAATLH